MLSVGLTGSAAAGKSRVAAVWEEAGVPVVDADVLARHVVEPGTAGLERVRAAFGDGVIASDGTLDRSALRGLAFADSEARARLEGLLHPLIAEAREAWLEARASDGEALVVSEIPLLFETGAQSAFDVTVLVVAPDAQRLERLVETRRLSEEEARRIMAAQMPQDDKRALADIVIENGGTVEEVEAEARRVLAELRERAGVRFVRFDLHLHTSASWDCLSDPEDVWTRARVLGYERIAITDHNRTTNAHRMVEAHPERIVPGEEVRTAEGIDVIGLYLHEEIPKGTPAVETIERIRAQGGIPYLPHPYAGGKGGGGRMADELAALCDVVEVFNARLHGATANTRAVALAERHGKLRSAGSDAHTLGELGNAWIELPAHPNRPDALLRALRSARTGGREASLLVHLGSTWAKVRKRLPGGDR